MRTPLSITDAGGQPITIRAGVHADLPRLTAIYNRYVIETPTTFDLDPFTPEEREAWFARYSANGRHRLLVAEDASGVIGYTTSSPFHARRAYDTTVELTILSARDAVGRGLGRALYAALLDALRDEDIRLLVALITLPNDASCALHERFGFTRGGLLPQAGRKFDALWDVAIYTRLWGDAATTPGA